MDTLERTARERQAAARLCRQWTPDQFHAQLREAGVTRAYLVYENGAFSLSHPALLRPLQSFFELSQDFSSHEGVFIGREEGIEALFFAFVHDTRRGLAQGGLRFAPYANLAEVLVDGLRLSQGMTRKNALAGLNWGGGKGIMTLPSRYRHPREFAPSAERQACFEAYGRFVASLGGVYYTAEDVGTSTRDMSALLSQSRFTTCIPPARGGSGNPSPFTARGVLRAMQAAWLFLTGSDNLRGVKVAVQGTGNVGASLIRSLDDLGAEVLITDVNQASLAEILAQRPHLQVIDPPEAIFDVCADIFAPCAIGAQVNVATIPRLKVRLVCGAANNILKEPEADAERLRQRNIAFVPDFLCNRMGIVNCADEWQGYLAEDVQLAAERVFPDTLRVFNYAHSRHCTPTQAANELADMAASELHPLLGHRGRRIIDHLMRSGWAQGGATPERIRPFEPIFVASLDEPPLRLQWEREAFFRGDTPVLAATPVTTAFAPSLADILSAVLLDIKSRALRLQTGVTPRRLLGAEHGGLALQLAVERNLPYPREALGRPEFVSLCQDHYFRHEAQVREQLQACGVGFDPPQWLSPMRDAGATTVQALYDFLQRAGLIYTQECIAYHSPTSGSVLVASDLRRGRHAVMQRYYLKCMTSTQTPLEVPFFFAEYLPGVVALGVHPASSWAVLAGQSVAHPLYGHEIPVLASAELQEPVEWVIPLARKYHERIAREHNLNSELQLFDSQGRLSVPGYQGLSVAEARRKILTALESQLRAEHGHWQVDALYCARSGDSVVPRYSTQVFVRIGEAVAELEKALRADAVSFSDLLWKERILKILSRLSLWCISRQYWWGNSIPGREDVFSTWFSMAAWVLQGAGWPENPKPAPIDAVFVDQELLFRWIVPALLVGQIVTGRPLFRHIHVHGTLHVSERQLLPRSTASEADLDEERFLYRRLKRPMKYRLGNLVEPVTLIRRFGADALRLGYVLALDNQTPEIVMLSEDRLRLARKQLRALNGKVSGFFQKVRRAGPPQPLNALDQALLQAAAQALTEARQAYADNRFERVGQLLIAESRRLISYINTVMKQRDAFGQARAAGVLSAALHSCIQAFAPLCPFFFTKLEQWFNQHPELQQPLPPLSGDWDWEQALQQERSTSR